ncbi:MAG: DUF4430 domain-containing protein [Candidatus Doudnabacteria bacterium]|nr:DUF4430 domain-containing protein [Candidatus Doudnabacteria bacterium]
MTKYKFIVALSLIALVFDLFAPLPAAASYDAAKAVQYLKSGSIDEWTVMALAAAGSLSGVNTDFLQNDAGGAATATEKRILAAVAAGQNPQNHLTALTALYNGTEINAAAGLLNDDIWGLLAFAAARANSSAQAQLASFIRQNQNVNGGWSYAKAPSDSDSNDTAVAIMALLAAGESPDAGAITRGFGYLASTLTDTGFAFDADSGFGPDSASTSWAISAYLAAARTVPVSARVYLENLQKTDGSFPWQQGGSGNPQMTAHAVIALSGKFFPVRAGGVNSSFEVSIIGPSATIFSGHITLPPGATALAVLAESAKTGNFSYVVKDTSLGLFVESIGGIGPSGDKGWMYAVNGVKPSVGASQYVLQNGDKLVWFYGAPEIAVPIGPPSGNGQNSAVVNLSLQVSVPADPEPTIMLAASRTSIGLGDTVQLSWSAQNASAVVTSTPGNWAGAALSGTITVQPPQTTIYSIMVSGPGGTKQATVQINVDTTPQIVFGVNPNNLHLGDLSPSHTTVQGSLVLANAGRNNLAVTATLQNADGLYQQALFLNGFLWSAFRENLDTNFSKNVNVSVVLPAGYRNNGIKTGTLIFWAVLR